jgi:zinc/manganese transport system substrate-binding protein
MLRRFLLLLLSLAAAGGAPAETLRVVATTSSMGALVRAVGGDAVELRVLAPPDRDAHHLQATPAMMLALRRADLVVAVGADLEVGWLPLAVRQAANPAILPGRAGHFEAAAAVSLLERGQPADRALGDVHPAGNPHLYLDPERMSVVARALAGRLAELDGSRAATYRDRASAFAGQVAARLPGWRERLVGSPGVLAYHRDADYFLERFGVPSLGYIEPVPGVPPTARHIQELVTGLRGKSGVIVYAPYYPSQAPQQLAGILGWASHALPVEPPLDADGAGYLAHIERWVSAVAPARP